MANLRTLLTKFNDRVSSSTASTNPTGCMFHFIGNCNYTPDGNYGNHCMDRWRVPTGATCVTFEIWGGGGGGAGGCCCMQGQPGGSGAYAKKTIAATTDWCYGLYPAYPTDCSATCCGIIGCNTYVSGCNLSNFCANGGCGGKTCCFTFWGNYNCAGNNNGYVYLCYDGVNNCACYYGADSGAPGRPGFLWSQCSCASCYWKYAVPYPGGLTNKCGGFVMLRVQGNACNQEWIKCINTAGGYYSQSDRAFVPGAGGISATSCGGGCCYGFPGNNGMVRITYR